MDVHDVTPLLPRGHGTSPTPSDVMGRVTKARCSHFLMIVPSFFHCGGQLISRCLFLGVMAEHRKYVFFFLEVFAEPFSGSLRQALFPFFYLPLIDPFSFPPAH